MPPSMDKSHSTSAASPGYETRDANVRGVFNFLVFLGVLLVVCAVLSLGTVPVFFEASRPDPAHVSPFAEYAAIAAGASVAGESAGGLAEVPRAAGTVSRNLCLGKPRQPGSCASPSNARWICCSKKVCRCRMPARRKRAPASAVQGCEKAGAAREQETMTSKTILLVCAAGAPDERASIAGAAGDHATDPARSQHCAKPERADSCRTWCFATSPENPCAWAIILERNPSCFRWFISIAPRCAPKSSTANYGP